MSGIRQHYIPRFLLNGFSVNHGKKKRLIWLYRKGCEPRVISTRDIGLSKKFYGEPGPESIDEKITQKENQLAAAINEVVDTGEILQDQVGPIIEFFVNIIIRTKYIRKSLARSARGLLDIPINQFSDTKILASYIENIFESENNDFRNSLISHLRNESGGQSPLFEYNATEHIKKNAFILSQIFAFQHKKALIEMLEKLKGKFESQCRDAQLRGLIAAIDEEKRITRHERYAQLKWRIELFKSDSFLLGVVCALQQTEGSDVYSPPLFSGKKRFALFLPIRHNAILIGSSPKFKFKIDPTSLNMASIQISDEFYISRKKSNYYSDKSELLSSKSDEWWENKIPEFTQKFKDDYL